jgi:hypothetical protein
MDRTPMLTPKWVAVCGVVLPALLLIGTFFAIALPIAMVRMSFTVLPASLWLSGWVCVLCLAASLSSRRTRLFKPALMGLALGFASFCVAGVAQLASRFGPFGLNPPAPLPLTLCITFIAAGMAAMAYRLYLGFAEWRETRPSPTTVAEASPEDSNSSRRIGWVRPTVALLLSLLPVLLVMVALPGGFLIIPAYWPLCCIPVYFYLRAKRWFNAWQAAVAGFLLGFLPWVLQGFFASSADSARIGSCVTVVNRVRTLCGHWMDVTFALRFGVVGVVAALLCWSVDLRVRKRQLQGV